MCVGEIISNRYAVERLAPPGAPEQRAAAEMIRGDQHGPASAEEMVSRRSPNEASVDGAAVPRGYNVHVGHGPVVEHRWVRARRYRAALFDRNAHHFGVEQKVKVRRGEWMGSDNLSDEPGGARDARPHHEALARALAVQDVEQADRRTTRQPDRPRRTPNHRYVESGSGASAVGAACVKRGKRVEHV